MKAMAAYVYNEKKEMEKRALVLANIKVRDFSKDVAYKVVPLTRSEYMRNFVSQWSPDKVRAAAYSDGYPMYPGDDAQDGELWDWLWSFYAPDDDAHRKMNLTKASFDALFDQAKSNHYIYPDGTVSEWCKRYLNHLVVQEIMGTAKRAGRDAGEKKEKKKN